MLNKFFLCLLGTFLLPFPVKSQVVIYQQNFDGNNGTFANGIISQTTATNGWLASSTAVQYSTYRHVWNFGNTGTGNVAPISGRSLGMGFYNGNNPNVANSPFRTWDGTNCSAVALTTRWAHIGVSTVGYQNIQVEFKWRCTGEADAGVAYDYGTVNTSIDGGSTWLMDLTGGQGSATGAHGTFAGGLYFNNSAVLTQVINLPATRDDKPNFRLAFRMVVDECYGTGGGFIIDDIIIRGTPIAACIGGTASGPGFVFTGGTASLSLAGYTGTAIQWQVSANGSTGWADVSGGTGMNGANYTTAALANGTYYYRAVVTDGGCTAYSSTVTVAVAATPVYCSGAGSGNAFSNNHIESIGFHEWMDPNPGNYSNNYFNYTDTTSYGYATVVAGQYHHLNALLRANGTGANATTFAYWIDWNGDGTFANTAFSSGGERMDNVLYTSTVGNTYASYFTVPVSALGMVRVRTRAVRGNQGNLDPCVAYTNSQTKDFMVKVIPSIGSQVCGAVNGSGDVVLTNSTVDKVNITRMLVEGPGGTVLDNNSQFFGVQVGATVTMYNYTNFMGYYSQGLELQEGLPYTVTIEHSGYTSAAGVFIDYNGDGDFNDANELVGRLSADVNPFVFNFNVPAVALDGKQVAMRIRLRYDDLGNLGGVINACNNISDGLGAYSEVEDYRVTLRQMVDPLPVELLSFRAVCEDGHVTLDWATASEINNEFFAVQHSDNLQSWSEVATVPGAGNSNQPLAYQTVDARPLAGVGYYRLVQTDYDGATETFGPISVDCGASSENGLSVYPNPADDRFTVSLVLDHAVENAVIEMWDVNGKPCTTRTVSLPEGASELGFDRQEWPSGVYFVRVRIGTVYLRPVKLVLK